MRDTTGHAKKRAGKEPFTSKAVGKAALSPIHTVAICNPDLFCGHFAKAGRGKRAALCFFFRRTMRRGNQRFKRQLCFAGQRFLLRLLTGPFCA